MVATRDSLGWRRVLLGDTVDQQKQGLEAKPLEIGPTGARNCFSWRAPMSTSDE